MTAVNNNASPMDGAPVIDFDKFKPTRSFTAARKRKDLAMRVLIALAFIVALIPLFSVLLTTIINGVKRLNLNFLSYNMTGVVGGNPTPSGGYGGILHAIIGTLEITFGAMLISIPIGLMCAVYLVEYSNRGKLAQVITLLVDVMSGIPSIVAGLFAFSMFTILIGPGTINGFEGSVALSLLMLPDRGQVVRGNAQDRAARFARGLVRPGRHEAAHDHEDRAAHRPAGHRFGCDSRRRPRDR